VNEDHVIHEKTDIYPQSISFHFFSCVWQRIFYQLFGPSEAFNRQELKSLLQPVFDNSFPYGKKDADDPRNRVLMNSQPVCGFIADDTLMTRDYIRVVLLNFPSLFNACIQSQTTDVVILVRA